MTESLLLDIRDLTETNLLFGDYLGVKSKGLDWQQHGRMPPARHLGSTCGPRPGTSVVGSDKGLSTLNLLPTCSPNDLLPGP